MRTAYDKTIRIMVPIVAGAGCMLALLSAANAIAELGQATPHVGDIISFAASASQPVEDGTRLIVHRPDRVGCVLDLGILRRSGGSLVVEKQVNDGPQSFRVHWAGKRTTADASNCGDNADLILEGQQLDTVALAAGGYGAGEKALPALAAVTNPERAAYMIE